MSFKTVEAGRGIQWIPAAIQLVMSEPGVFLLMALIIAAINIVPFAGVILGPALIGGVLFAYREKEEGRMPQVGQLFQAFQIPGKIGPMIALCIPSIVAAIVCVVVVFVTMGAAMAGLGYGGSHHSGAAGVGVAIGALIGGLIIFALSLAAGAMVIFAIPRVMFDGAEPFAAMKESLSAAIANFGAILIFSIVSVVMFCVAAVILVIPFFGALIWGFAISAFSCAAIYQMYREIYGVTASGNPAEQASMMPPSMPPGPPPAPPAS